MDSSELAELDAAVARTEGFRLHTHQYVQFNAWHSAEHDEYMFLVDNYSPSTDWSQGGPIIERERIELVPFIGSSGKWEGAIGRNVWGDDAKATGIGPTPLIAAMRAFVASKK